MMMAIFLLENDGWFMIGCRCLFSHTKDKLALRKNQQQNFMLLEDHIFNSKYSCIMQHGISLDSLNRVSMGSGSRPKLFTRINVYSG